jgi:thioredoxin 1
MDELKQILYETEIPIVIFFTATWCGPCQRIYPLYTQLSKEIQNCKFLKYDVDEDEEIAAAFDIESMPTFIFIKHHHIVNRFSGADKNQLIDAIKSILNNKI